MTKNSEYCGLFCKGREFEIPKNGDLTAEGLLLNKDGTRSWYFSIVGNNPSDPKIALVGLCPAYNQLKTLVGAYNSGLTFLEAANISGFSRMRKNIIKLLKKINIDKYLGVEMDENDFDFNKSPHFYITSLAKCASMQEGQGRSNDYDLIEFECSKLCLKKRFLNDILNPSFKNLKKIIIFGKKGQNAVTENILEGEQNIKTALENSGKEVIFLPHPSGSNNGRIAEFLKSPS